MVQWRQNWRGLKNYYGKCTIDRIDVNEDYCPSNCRWVDAKTQGNNKRAYHTQYTTKFA